MFGCCLGIVPAVLIAMTFLASFNAGGKACQPFDMKFLKIWLDYVHHLLISLFLFSGDLSVATYSTNCLFVVFWY